MAAYTRDRLLDAAKQFCDAFASQKSPDEIFSHFSSSDEVLAFEHGLPQLGPFLGREFKGQNGIREYFRIISNELTYEDMTFSNYLVDAEAMQVSVRGQARFCNVHTKQAWNETFTYVLALDGELKVKRYEIWADTGAAYLASQGELK